MKIKDILESDSPLGYSDFNENGNVAAKKAKSPKISFLRGDWKKSGRGEFSATDNGNEITIRFFSVTIYSKSGRLREPSKTKYLVYASVTGKGIYGADIDFGSARGESQASKEKIEKSEEKAILWAKSVCGIDLGKYDFKY